MFKSLLLCVLALTVVACAGPMTSTAVLQDRGQDGGTVRIIVPAYPPDTDTQTQTKELVAQVCKERSWQIVDMTITQAQKNSVEKNSNWAWVSGYGVPASKNPCEDSGPASGSEVRLRREVGRRSRLHPLATVGQEKS